MEDKFQFVGKKEAKTEMLEIAETLKENTVIECLAMMVKTVAF